MRSIIAWFTKTFSAITIKSAIVAGLVVVGVAGVGIAIVLNPSNDSKPIVSEKPQSQETTQRQDKTDGQVADENTSPPSNTPEQQPARTQNPPANNTPRVNPNSLPDKYGCIPQSSGYQDCVKTAKQNELNARCYEQERSANSKYSAAIDNAKAAYDTVMADWEKVKDLPYYQRHPYDQYATDAKTKHNAISKPAYLEYVSTLNSIRGQGCQVTQLYPDYSWAGY